ncbi:MAG TPA: hypothetical protein VHY37_07190 [Tepidisphaeraceae bacterium]|jgi:hypothetical protein|nr:hypothetical protein [Tepidisphaeraceae bacterium]
MSNNTPKPGDLILVLRGQASRQLARWLKFQKRIGGMVLVDMNVVPKPALPQPDQSADGPIAAPAKSSR